MGKEEGGGPFAGAPKGPGWGRHAEKAAHPSSPPPPDLQVLLLGDLLVLLQRQDERLVLKCHSRTVLGSSDPKQTFSPVLRLGSVLIRSVATGEPGPLPSGAEELGGGF